jgi:aryl-alcohol dehydrogenase-like predicted oxidoreductase/enamine deaminase RidA (YjgF/YER057c/UK114 family)
MQKVPQIALAPDLKISRLLTGLWQIADMERKDPEQDLNQLAKAMKAYADVGLCTFDMADHYGSAEIISGIFKKQYASGQAVQLFTKWVPEPGPSSKTKVREAVERSLRRLQADQIDLLQYHAWNYADPAWLDDLFYLQELKSEGLIRHLGLTNFDTIHLNMVLQSGIEVVSNQICYSLLDQRASSKMTALCQKHGVKVLAFGTLGGGFLTNKWLGKKEIPTDELSTWSEMKYKRFIDTIGNWDSFQNLLDKLNAIALKHQVSIANIASKYILEQPAVGGIIIGARLGQSEHIKQNLRLFQFELDQEDQAQIATALSNFKAVPGDCGDEYRKPPFLTASGDLSHHLEKFPAPYPVIQKDDGTSKVLSGTIWEDLAGFSRATKEGNRVLISGTTATHKDRLIGGNDPAAQTHFIIDKIEGVIQSFGGQLDNVVRTRIYIQNLDDWEAIARAHGERFGDIQPANTMIRADIIGEEYLVEIEAEAML